MLGKAENRPGLNESKQLTLLRYPGGKRRLLAYLAEHLPTPNKITGKYIEPFIGGGSVFFFLQPKKAILSDLNIELMDLYRGIKADPDKVWHIYHQMPSSKRGYIKIRTLKHLDLDLAERAARTLFLNRTCFKGMWRHNLDGEFNIGYGGQSRRWVITRQHLRLVCKFLKRASLKCLDFEVIIEEATARDYLFLDPPYRPGEREQLHAHYCGQQFAYSDHKRLSSALKAADKRGIPWSMTISSHPDIVKLYKGFMFQAIPRGTGKKIGALMQNSGEVLISNHNGELK